jgi:hypothetical protein
MNIHSYRFLLLGSLAVLPACISDPAGVQLEVPVPSARGVYVLNEGNFGRGNSTLTYYDLDTRQVIPDVFEVVNGRALGDVGNSIALHHELVYLVINNSDRIEVVHPATHASVRTISVGSGMSPRQLAFIDDSLALCTNLYNASVSIIHLVRGEVIGRIPVGPNPEGIAVAEGRAFVANSGLGSGSSMTVIDLSSRTPILTRPVGDNPAGVTVTPSGMVYVVCSGLFGDFSDPDDDTPARIAVIDPTTLSTVDSITIGGHAYQIAIHPSGLGYVVTTDSVVTVDTRVHRRVGTFLQGQYYSAAVESVSGDVYLSDAKDFLQPGTVYVYAAEGYLRTSFEAGVIPGSFAFKR